MIQLNVSEAYAFDYLAILLVKSLEGLKGASGDFSECSSNLSRQIGLKAYWEIMDSEEYVELFDANRDVFKLVDKATRDECKASEVDQANHRRYLAKRDLQERFWPDKPLAEAKTARSFTTHTECEIKCNS